MKHEEGKKLREQWKKSKNQECNHDNKVKEYILGSHTGDYICDKCGKEFSRND